LKPIALILEDHRLDQGAETRELRRSFPNLSVRRARSGKEAVALARVQAPDLFLLESGLLQRDGINAVKRIRSMLPATHVVLLTNAWNDPFQADAAKVGPSAHVARRNLSLF
jgi:CheY-like chemotaxis protein